MEKYIVNEMNPKESLIEYEYHIDDITLLGFKILSLPLKRSDWPNWFSNFNDRVDVRLRYLNHPKEYICISDIANDYKREHTMYNHLSVGDYILYDYRFDKVYATNYDGMLNLFNTITGYNYELLLDAAFESDKMEIPVLSSELNSDPGTITAGVLGVSGEKGPSGNTYKSDSIDIITGVIKTKKDNINPNHYKFGDMESMPFIDAVTEFGEFQPVETPHVKDAIKYLIRYPRKNGLEDLKKAQWFINHLIEVREKIENSVSLDERMKGDKDACR